MNEKTKKQMLVGNTFPMGLLRRRVLVCPVSLGAFRRVATGCRVCSFWGHDNTLSDVSRWVGVDLTPATPRPMLALDRDGFPSLDGVSFDACWVLSPNLKGNARPEPGEEVSADRVTSWQPLHMQWF